MVDPRKVFVVHGRNKAAQVAMFQFLRAIGLSPIEWSQAVQMTQGTTPYVGEILKTAFLEAQAIVVLFSGDDVAKLMEHFANADDQDELIPKPQARPNVLFEAGMAMGRNPDRTVLVELGKLRPFSDIGGRYTVRLDGTPEKRKELAERLEKAGCEVDISGNDWLSTGDFQSAIFEPEISDQVSLMAVPETSDLSEEEKKILVSALQGPKETNGQIHVFHVNEGDVLKAGDSLILESQKVGRETFMIYEEALVNLKSRGLVKFRSSSDSMETYEFTGRGYEVSRVLAR